MTRICRLTMTFARDSGAVTHYSRSTSAWNGAGADPIARRVVLTIVNGLRPDAIERFDLSNIRRVAERGASTLAAKSVSPSFSTTCMATLMTGVSPAEHGMKTDRFSFPRSLSRVDTLPRLIATEGFQVSGFMEDISPAIRGTAGLVGRELGFQSLSFKGRTCADILSSAVGALCTQRRGMIAIHFSDVDRAGHEYGWMSEEYGIAAQKVDRSIGILDALSGSSGGETLLVIVADHAGGGEDPRKHVSEHPLDVTVPVILSGRHIGRCALGDVSLLDLPPTILAALGIGIPRNYEGRIMSEAFETMVARSRVSA